MTVPRVLFLLVAFAVLAAGVVELRGAQIRSAARIGKLQRQRMDLRTESWALQVEIARLGTPQRIRDLSTHWSLDLHAPEPAADDPGHPPLVAGGWED